MQLQFDIKRHNDNELIHKANAADDGRVVVTRFLLWVPKLTPKDSLYDKFVSSFMKETKWTYLREMYASSASARESRFFQSSIDNIKRVLVYLQENLRDANVHQMHQALRRRFKKRRVVSRKTLGFYYFNSHSKSKNTKDGVFLRKIFS